MSAGPLPKVIRLAPAPGSVTVPALLQALTRPPELAPFAPETLAFLAALHRHLVGDAAAREQPDLQALAFWLRPAALTRMGQARIGARYPISASNARRPPEISG